MVDAYICVLWFEVLSRMESFNKAIKDSQGQSSNAKVDLKANMTIFIDSAKKSTESKITEMMAHKKGAKIVVVRKNPTRQKFSDQMQFVRNFLTR